MIRRVTAHIKGMPIRCVWVVVGRREGRVGEREGGGPLEIEYALKEISLKSALPRDSMEPSFNEHFWFILTLLHCPAESETAAME